MNQHPASDVRSLLELQQVGIAKACRYTGMTNSARFFRCDQLSGTVQERIIEILQRDGPIESSPTLEKLKTAQQVLVSQQATGLQPLGLLCLCLCLCLRSHT